MWNKFINMVSDDEIILHFRDSKKEKLEQVYTKIGFTNLEKSDTYFGK